MSILQGLCVGPAVDLTPRLWAAWKGEIGDQRLFFAYFDGKEWVGGSSFDSPIGSSVGPSLAYSAQSGAIYAAWKGSYCDEALWWAMSTGPTGSGVWTQQASFNTPTGSSVGPALAVSSNYSGGTDTLYAVWKGPSCDQGLYWASLDGLTWTQQTAAGPGLSSVGPSLAVLNGTIYAAWKGMTGDQRLWWSLLQNNLEWTGQQLFYQPNQFPNFPHPIGSSIGPSLAVLNGTIYAAWKGVIGDQGLYWAQFDGNEWLEPQQFPSNIGSSIGPALAVFNGILYAMWKGPSGDQGLYYTSYDPKLGWSSSPGSVVGNTTQDVMPC